MSLRKLCLLAALASGVLTVSTGYAGSITVHAVDGTDAGSGISLGNVYTHLVDFDPSGTPSTVNSVVFTQTATSGTNYSTTGLDMVFPGDTSATTPTGYLGLVNDFFYNNAAANGTVESLTLSGLAPSTTYDLRLYAKRFGGTGDREADVTDSTGGSLAAYDEDANAYQYISDVYTTTATGAGSTGFTLTFTINNGANAAASQHFYGFTNQVVPEPASLSLLALAGSLALVRRRRA